MILYRKNRLCWMVALFLYFGLSVASYAQLATPQILSSNMVLQQGKKVPVWGTARPGERVTVTFGDQRQSVRADREGHWQVELQPMKADKHPKQLVIKGHKDTITYDNILVGEVWLCSGQSNMEYPMKLKRGYAGPRRGKNLAEQELSEPANDMIRVYYVRRDKHVSSWKVADSTSLAAMSAVGYFFGRELLQKLNVPVGIISSSVGGTRIESWMPEEACLASPVFASEVKRDGRIDGQGVAERYDRMIAPLVPFALKGFLWYQGESNITSGIRERRYVEKYQLLVDSWRRAFHAKEAPFYYVLLAPYAYSGRIAKNGRPSTAEELPLMHEQQIKAQQVVDNTDYVVVSDLVDNLEDIHPSYKWTVGERLSRVALGKTYGQEGRIWSGPRIKEVRSSGDSVIATFEQAGDGLKVSARRNLRWFEVAGSDGIYRAALASIKGKDQVVIYSPEVKHPVSVRLGWHETAMPNLVNSEGLPAAPFRRTVQP